MKRVRVITLALVLAMLALLLTSCAPAKSAEESYAAAAWKASGLSAKPASVACIHFTKNDVLTSGMATPELSVAALPSAGYAYGFMPGATIDGLYIVFMDENGNVLTTLDYDTLNKTLSQVDENNLSQKAAYLNTISYIINMFPEMQRYTSPLGSDVKLNQWYTLSDDQIKAMMK